MTFRTRVAAIAAIVVAGAVLLACAAAYHASRDALLGSTDSSLQNVERAVYNPGSNVFFPNQVSIHGTGMMLVLPNGSVLWPQDADGPLPPSDATITSVAKGSAPAQFQTISVDGTALRELIVPVRRNVTFPYQGQPYYATTSVALVLYQPIQAVQSHLQTLGIALLVIAIVGVLLAALLGWLVARASLVPLGRTTRDIEELASTLDVSRRVEEGRNDELGRLRHACNRLLEALQGAQESQRQLILDSSHELRTPLTSLRMNAQVLSRFDELSDDDAAQLADDMVTQVDELTTLVGDLVELARGEHSVEAEEDVDLDELVTECADVAQTHARTKAVTLDVDVARCVVHARRTRLARAIGNLLDNAIKFAPREGRVRVTCRSGVVTVEDDGPGIAESDLPHVFDRFYRSPRDRGLPGSGLGLAIVAQVASEASGTVEAGTSQSLGGARMVLRLPLSRSGSEPILTSANPRP